MASSTAKTHTTESTSTTKGSCLCGAVRYEFTGEATYAICHCAPCQKSSGTPCSHNLLTNTSSFNLLTPLSGLNIWVRKESDSGLPVQYHSCAVCPTLIYVTADVVQGSVMVNAGTVDREEMSKGPPALEFYTKRRVPWLGQCSNAAQFEGGPEYGA